MSSLKPFDEKKGSLNCKQVCLFVFCIYFIQNNHKMGEVVGAVVSFGGNPSEKCHTFHSFLPISPTVNVFQC